MNALLEMGIIKSVPKPWTHEAVETLENLVSQGLNNKRIAEIMGRTEVSISIKRKRLQKDRGTYNAKHVEEKYETNELFLELIKPESVLDVYAGGGFYRGRGIKKLVENDINTDCESKKDATDFVFENRKKSFDLVDLDPFGSAFEQFDYAIGCASKGLCITFGELGHKRFKRLDFVQHRYGINDFEGWMDKFIAYVVNRGMIHKKKIVPIFVKEWSNIGRVYFTVEPFKQTSQWDKNMEKRNDTTNHINYINAT